MFDLIINRNFNDLQQLSRKDMAGSYSKDVLIPYVSYLIRENAKYSNGSYSLHIDDLDKSDQENFCAHMIRFDAESQDEWAWIMEIDDGSISKKLTQFMFSANKEDMYDFLSTLSEYAISYYKERMNELLQDNLESIYHEDMKEAGLRWNTHADNGEGYYSCF